MVSTGISGSVTPSSTASARSRRVRHLPCGAGICSLEVLHFRQQKAEMLGVPPISSARLHPAIRRTRQRRAPQHSCQAIVVPAVAQSRGSGNAPAAISVGQPQRSEQFASIGPQIIDRAFARAMAFVCAITKPDQPFGGMAQMIGGLLLRLRGDRGDGAVGRALAARQNRSVKAETSSSRAMLKAKSPFGSSTMRQLRQPGASRR